MFRYPLDPHRDFINRCIGVPGDVIEVRDGRVFINDQIDGETIRMEKDPGGHVRMIVTDYKGDLHPQVVLEDQSGKILDFYYLPEKANIEVIEGKTISAGTRESEQPRMMANGA